MDSNANTIENGLTVTCDFASDMEGMHVLFDK